ncbi:MAG TPA: ATP-binding protein [Candidatus Binatia bacterium]|nr:ATP-binding protein [Candidatus Binatia bacterium]
MASKLLDEYGLMGATPSVRLARGPDPAMDRNLQTRFFAAFLALVSVAAIVFAWINFQKDREYFAPYDGVWWVEDGGHLRAQRVEPDGPGQKAGIKADDRLVAVEGRSVSNVGTLEHQLYNVGVWSKANYSLLRQGVSLEAPVILTPADRSLYAGLRLIALVYLGIGIYVLFRRWTAPKSTHFYVFCLVSFIFYGFHYTGKLNDFDWIVYWSNVVAWLLQPALFLHFSLTFPERKGLVDRRPWLIPAAYVPGALLLAIHICVISLLQPSELLRWNLDRIEWLYLAGYFVAATFTLWHSYRHAETGILRQQMKWVTRGTILSVAPFTAFYIVPYLFGSLPGLGMKVSVLSLVFLPLTFGYAIFRYRLMDVDLIFKRGMAYTIAAGAITAAYFAAVGMASVLFHQNFPSVGPIGLVIAIAVTAILFDPFKNWVQEHLDRFFYRKRYDYRRTLIEFGRDLNSETDLDKMLTSIVDRLSRTLLVDRLAVFLSDAEQPEQFYLAKSYGISHTSGLDFNFLHLERPEWQSGHLFFDNTNHAVRETASARETIRRLELNYYIPCMVMNRMIAVLGLGKTSEGDFLSSEDVQLLETLAGYIGIAVQNARLYKSLEEKAGQYERLKEFSENIVESISVGVMAVDLEDRIESWNSQMEVMLALPRHEAVGRPMAAVMPPAFLDEFYRVRQSQGIHNLYKFRLGTRAGEMRTTNIAIAPLVSKNFSVIGRLIIVDDITERMELESQLSQAEKLSSIGLLAAGVAHEVNTPLAVISSYAQMLAKQVHGDDRQSALLEKITKQTFRASEIVNSLLNFSRTSGTEFADVDLNRVIKDTLTLLEHQFKTGRISVQQDLYPDLPPIHGNIGKLQQVFLNLFLNARDAMPGGGTLSITTLDGHHVQVKVSDTGTGIAQEHIHRIYDPFFTTKNKPKTGHSSGTGLGLSVTYGIIQEHAGKIRVDSAPGRGTTFIVEFPLVRKAVSA